MMVVIRSALQQSSRVRKTSLNVVIGDGENFLLLVAVRDSLAVSPAVLFAFRLDATPAPSASLDTRGLSDGGLPLQPG